MASYIDWYIVELEGRLCKKLPRDLSSDIGREVREHLEATASDLERDNETREHAERAAIKKFGSPGRVAWKFVTAHVPRGAQPLSWWPPIWAAATTLWIGGWLIAGNHPTNFWAALVGGPVLAFLFCVSSLMTRRARPWAIAGVTLASVVLTIGMLSLTWLDLYQGGGLGFIPRWQVAPYANSIRKEIPSFESQLPELEAGIVAFATSDRTTGSAMPIASPQSAPRLGQFYRDGLWRVPRDFGLWGPPVPGYAFEPYTVEYGSVAGLKEARFVWKTTGPNVVRGLRHRIEADQKNLFALTAAQSYPVTKLAQEFSVQLAGPGIALILIFLVLNLVCVHIGEFVRWIRIARLRVA